MADAGQTKVLVFGAVDAANLNAAMDRANALNAKSGPFALLLLLGDILNSIKSDENKQDIANFLSGEKPSSIPVYLSGSSNSAQQLLEEALEISSNISLIGPNEIVKTPSGIVMGNSFDDKVPQNVGENQIDIVFGQTWPLELASERAVPHGSEHCSEFIKRTNPQYIFESDYQSTTFWERPPFTWSENKPCRFVALSKYGSKSKYAYAFNFKKRPVLDASATYSGNPFDVPVRAHDNNRDETNGSKRNRRDNAERRLSKKQKKGSILPSNCFFCLSNPKLDKSLIISIADDSYVALAKGPISHPDALSALGFSGHLLFIPFAHVPTYSDVPLESRDKVILERRKYLLAIKQLYSENGLSHVAYEISRSRGVHISTQILPFPEHLVEKLEETLKSEVQSVGLTVSRQPVTSDATDYLTVDLPGDRLPITISIPEGYKFDMLLCRRVIVDILGVSEQVDWKQCSQSVAEETRDGKICREKFKGYDFAA